MKGVHLQKVQVRAERWAARFEDEPWPKPPREAIAKALRAGAWMRWERVEGSLHEADDLVRLIRVDLPALIAEVWSLRERNEALWAELRDYRARLAEQSAQAEYGESDVAGGIVGGSL